MPWYLTWSNCAKPAPTLSSLVNGASLGRSTSYYWRWQLANYRIPSVRNTILGHQLRQKIVFFSSFMCRFLMKHQNLLDSGLAANDGYFWQEVAKKFQEVNEEYNNLAYTDFMFVGVNPSIKLQHNWSSFWRFTRLSLNLMVRSLRTLRKVKIMMI